MAARAAAARAVAARAMAACGRGSGPEPIRSFLKALDPAPLDAVVHQYHLLAGYGRVGVRRRK